MSWASGEARLAPDVAEEHSDASAVFHSSAVHVMHPVLLAAGKDR